MTSVWKGFFIVMRPTSVFSPELCWVLALPPQLPCEKQVIPTAGCVCCWEDPSWEDFRCKHRMGSPLLDIPAAQCLRLLPPSAMLFPSSWQGPGHLHPSPWASIFLQVQQGGWLTARYGLTRYSLSLKYGIHRVWRDQEAQLGRETEWLKAPTGQEKNILKRIEINCKQFERPQSTVWGFDISPYVQNSHRWSHGSHRKKWRDERRQFMKILQLAVGL